jgi:hypothetical protein
MKAVSGNPESANEEINKVIEAFMEGDEARLMDTMCQSISKGSYSLFAAR